MLTRGAAGVAPGAVPADSHCRKAGTTSGLSGAGSQEFTQNTPGVPGTAEDTDSFGGALVGR